MKERYNKKTKFDKKLTREMFPSLRPLVVEKLCQMGKLCRDTWKSIQKETSVVLTRLRIQMQVCKIVSGILGIAEKMAGVWLTTL